MTLDELRRWRDCKHDWAWECCRMLCTKCGWQRPTDETLEYAQTRIAALKAEVDRLEGDRDEQAAMRAGTTNLYQSTLDRAEQAEADLAAWRAFCDEWVDIAFEVQQQDHRRYTQAEAEVARLSTQRCATCSSLGSENDDTFVCLNVMAPAPMTDAELEDPGETWCCCWYRREG